MDLGAAIEALSQRVEQANIGAQPEDYEVDGLLYCGKCNTPRQTIIDLTQVFTVNGIRKVNCLCKCRVSAIKAEEDQRNYIEFLRAVEKNRRICFPKNDTDKEDLEKSELESWTFDKDDGKDPRTIRAMRGYVENFTDFQTNGKGLLLYGNCGGGKTFAAACVANALVDKGYKCLMTKISKIVNEMSGMYEGKQEYLDSLNRFDLLIFDDLGAERSTEYMAEMVLNIIDARYIAGLPMIITTNLTSDELKQPKNIFERRIYSRLFEKCHPIHVDVPDRRRQKMKEGFAEMQKLLGL